MNTGGRKNEVFLRGGGVWKILGRQSENKNYVTTVPGEFPGMDFVRKTELVYRDWVYDESYVPYYRIYVEFTDRKLDNGLNTYGA